MMGTKIDVSSRHGEGTRFSFALPIRNAVYADEQRGRLSARLMEEKNILIADASADSAKVLASILAHFGARTRVVHSTDQLQTLLERGRYDAICIDSRMLGSIDGRTLKAHCDALVVLLYEILPDTGTKQLAPDAVLNKPFTPLGVQSLMTDIFGKSIVKNSVTKKHIGFDDILVLRGSRILLAEDNEGNVMVIEGLLEGSGISLHSAPNGQKAVEMILKSSVAYDLVLMDINMPIMDGYAATSIIREYQKYDNLPIVAMTANMTESDMNKMKSLGMQDFIGKPVNVERFYGMLLKYIAPKRVAADVRPAATQKASQTRAQQTPLSIPGVDTNEGLARVNGNRDAYLRVLEKYAELFGDVGTKLLDASQKRAWDEGRALAHNLKGLSGNIGAGDIYRLAAEIESGFKTGNANLAAQIRGLTGKLAPVLDAIRLQSRANAQRVSEKQPITPAALSGILESLRESAARKKALEVKQGCSALKTYALPQERHEAFEHLFESAERYQYDSVVARIDTLLGEIG